MIHISRDKNVLLVYMAPINGMYQFDIIGYYNEFVTLFFKYDREFLFLSFVLKNIKVGVNHSSLTMIYILINELYST